MECYINGKRESKRFWRLVAKNHPDDLRIATEFHSYYPQYPINETLFFLSECKAGEKRCPGKCYVPAAKVVILTEEEVLSHKELPVKIFNEEAYLPEATKRAIFNVPLLIDYLKTLNDDDPNCAIHSQKVLIIAKRMLRNYLTNVVDCVVDFERERRNLISLDDSVLRIRDAQLVYSAVESIGGTLNISQEAMNALNKLPDS